MSHRAGFAPGCSQSHQGLLRFLTQSAAPAFAVAAFGSPSSMGGCGRSAATAFLCHRITPLRRPEGGYRYVNHAILLLE